MRIDFPTESSTHTARRALVQKQAPMPTAQQLHVQLEKRQPFMEWKQAAENEVV
jgi:hypothetical protein